MPLTSQLMQGVFTMMINRKRTSSAVAAAIWFAAAAFPTGSAAGAPQGSAWLPELTESSELAGPSFVTGTLVDAKGRPASGTVVAIAWPRPEVMATLQPGDAVKTAPVAKATIGRTGTFALKVDPRVSLAEFMSADGTVNVDLWGETADGSSVFSFPAIVATDSVPAGAEATSGMAVATSPDALDVTLQPNTPASNTPGAVLAPAADKACTTTVEATYNSRVGIVGEVYPGPHSKADFQYLSSSSSTLGVGFDQPGAPVSWSISGTSSVSSSASIDYPTQPSNSSKVFETTFGYQKVHSYLYGTTGCQDKGTSMRPYAWQGSSLSYVPSGPPTATNCSAELAGAVVTKDTANAVTFTNGLKMSSVIGFDLSLKTGFNTQTKIKHTFATAGQLCGSNDFWPQAARIVGK